MEKSGVEIGETSKCYRIIENFSFGREIIETELCLMLILGELRFFLNVYIEFRGVCRSKIFSVGDKIVWYRGLAFGAWASRFYKFFVVPSGRVFRIGYLKKQVPSHFSPEKSDKVGTSFTFTNRKEAYNRGSTD